MTQPSASWPSSEPGAGDQLALARAARRLTAAGIRPQEAKQDAQALAQHAEDADDYDRLLSRRAERVPLSHLIGRTAFRGITLRVGQGVFTPQPETSSVVEWAVRQLTARGPACPVIADLCTGSGTIALALANELPHAVVHAVERDDDALAWTRRNAEDRAAAGDTPVHLHQGDAGDCLPELDGQVDLVISNPPYVAEHETDVPSTEVVDHDPGIALWAGSDGLDVIRMVERTAARLLKVDGLVVVEHSDRQGATAPAAFFASGDWSDVEDHVDHDGLDRFVTARRRRR